MAGEEGEQPEREETFIRSIRSLPTVEEMERFFLSGIVGTKELRGWLERVDPDFAAVRDADVDAEIARLAKMRQEQLTRSQEADEDEEAPPTVLTREGEEVPQP